MKYRILLLLSFLMMASAGWGQTDLAGWTFPSAPISSSTIIAAECGEFQSSANIYMDGSNGSSTFTNITGFAGHAPIATYQVCNVITATQALAIVGDTNNNKGIVFKFPTTGYEDLKLSYSTRGTNAGYGTHVWSYSTNGTSFTNISTITGRKSTSFSTQTVDFSSVAALDNQAYVYIKVTISGATDPGGNNRFDNIKFYATEAVTADPIITLSNNGTQVTAGNVEQSTQNHILSTFKLEVEDANSNLNEAYFITSGNYLAADVDGFKLWYSSSNSFASATQLGGAFTSTSTGSGDILEFDGLTQNIAEDATGYFWVTADVSATATTGRTISLDGIAGADFVFASGNASGSASAGGTQTITVNTSPAIVIENIENTNFGSVCVGSISATTGSFDFYGMNLTGNAIIGPLTGYTFSTDALTFYPNLTLLPDGGGDILEEIYIRFTPISDGSFNGNIPISGGGATPTSVAVTGTGVALPSIIAHPTNQNVNVGQTATFNVAATGQALSYQWQVNEGSGWANVSNGTGSTTQSYTTPATTMAMNGYQYRVIINNDCGEITSNAAALTVNLVSNSSDYFRSRTAGPANWSSNSTWESSADQSTWINATIYPGANASGVEIQVGHTVIINNLSITITNTHVYGTLTVGTNGAYSVNGNEEIELTIEDGGVFMVDRDTFATPSGNAYGLVKTGGKIVAGPSIGSGSDFVSAYVGYNYGLFYFGNGGICEWNNTRTLGSSTPDDSEYFNPYETGDIPIFRIITSPTVPFGSSANTTVFHAIVEFVGGSTFTVDRTQPKIFKYGFRGDGTLIQTNTNGAGNINIGDVSVVPVIEDNVTFRVYDNNLKIPNGLTIPAGANITMESVTGSQNTRIHRQGGTLNINGTLDITNMRITNTASGGINVNNGGSIRTRHTLGLFGPNSAIVEEANFTLNDGSTVEYYATENQSISSGKTYYHLIFSGSGTKEPENQTDVHDLGSITITGDPVVDYSENNLGLTIINDTNFTMDGGKLIIGTGGTQPRPGGTYNLTGGAIEFTGNSNTDIKVTPTYHDIIISGTNKTPGGIDFKINNILSVTSTGELTILSTPDNENPYVVTAKGGVQVETGGELVLENNANLMQDVGAVNTGNIKQIRNAIVPSDQYNFWSSPVSNMNLYALYPNIPENRVMTYNTQTDYYTIIPNNPSNPPKFQFGIGYSIKGPTSNYPPTNPYNNSDPSAIDVTATFIGTPNNESASLPTIPLSYDGNNYNLIGNPFPSNLDLVKVYDEGGLLGTDNEDKFFYDINEEDTPTVYFWDNISNTEIYQQGSSYNQSNFALFNLAAETGTAAPCESETCVGSGSGKIPNGIVKPGQGFIMRASGVGANSITLKNNMRTTEIKRGLTDYAPYFKNGNTINSHDNVKRKDKFWLELINPNDFHIQMAVGYFEKAENTFERFDTKVWNEAASDNIYTFSEDNVKLTIQGRKGIFQKDDVIPLGAAFFVQGKYKIQIVQTQGIFVSYQDIYLKDKLLNVIYNLSENGAYEFEAPEGVHEDRFEILFKDGSTAGPVLTTASQNKINILKRDNQIEISSSKDKITKVEIFDLAGWPVYKNPQVNSKVLRIPALSFDKQIIVVKIETETGEIQTKKFVNK